jgi:hypothetical protein
MEAIFYFTPESILLAKANKWTSSTHHQGQPVLLETIDGVKVGLFHFHKSVSLELIAEVADVADVICCCNPQDLPDIYRVKHIFPNHVGETKQQILDMENPDKPWVFEPYYKVEAIEEGVEEVYRYFPSLGIDVRFDQKVEVYDFDREIVVGGIEFSSFKVWAETPELEAFLHKCVKRAYK